METIAPSLAKSKAVALPIPLSPPVMSATLLYNFPLVNSCGSVWGTGFILLSTPGRGCFCLGFIFFFSCFFIIQIFQKEFGSEWLLIFRRKLHESVIHAVFRMEKRCKRAYEFNFILLPLLLRN